MQKHHCITKSTWYKSYESRIPLLIRMNLHISFSYWINFLLNVVHIRKDFQWLSFRKKKEHYINIRMPMSCHTKRHVDWFLLPISLKFLSLFSYTKQKHNQIYFYNLVSWYNGWHYMVICLIITLLVLMRNIGKLLRFFFWFSLFEITQM